MPQLKRWKEINKAKRETGRGEEKKGPHLYTLAIGYDISNFPISAET